MDAKIVLISILGFLALMGLVIFGTMQSEQLEYKHFETCVNAGGSYSEEGIGRKPVCEMP